MRIFQGLEKTLEDGSGRRKITKTNYQAEGVLYLPEESRYSGLMELPEEEDVGTVLNDAMKAIEPYHGRIYDPACGSGVMFVQSAEFVSKHRKNAANELSVLRQERR